MSGILILAQEIQSGAGGGRKRFVLIRLPRWFIIAIFLTSDLDLPMGFFPSGPFQGSILFLDWLVSYRPVAFPTSTSAVDGYHPMK